MKGGNINRTWTVFIYTIKFGILTCKYLLYSHWYSQVLRRLCTRLLLGLVHTLKRGPKGSGSQRWMCGFENVKPVYLTNWYMSNISVLLNWRISTFFRTALNVSAPLFTMLLCRKSVLCLFHNKGRWPVHILSFKYPQRVCTHFMHFFPFISPLFFSFFLFCFFD